MIEKISRNAPCPCGSGLKFKHCCGVKGGSTLPVRKRGRVLQVLVLLAVCAGAVYAVRYFDPFSSRPSAPVVDILNSLDLEADRTITPGAKINPLTGLYDPPPGLVPDGKEWSSDHGHWHDTARPATTAAQPPEGAPYPQPPGDVPEGKVWSPEHGHWHNIASPQAPSVELGEEVSATAVRPPEGAPYPQPPGEVPEGKVWSPEHGHWHNDLSKKADPVEVAEGVEAQPVSAPEEAAEELAEEPPVSAPAELDADNPAEE